MDDAVRWSIWLIVVGVCIAGFSTAAGAYERTKTCNSFGAHACDPGEEPKPIEWPVRCVRYQINEQGSSDFSDGDTISQQLRSLVREAFETWNAPSCSDFTMVEGPLTSNTTVEYDDEAGWDENMNLIVWRDEEWPYGSMSSAFALTSVTYSSETGRIADADMEFNGADHEFAHLSESRVGETEKVDFSNTLTHEVGHFLGLAHSDESPATMYGWAPPGETKKRTLHQDDVDGLCAIYPVRERMGECEYPEDFVPSRSDDEQGRDEGEEDEDEEPPTSSSCCSLGSGPVPKGSLLFGGVLFVLLRLYGRRRR